MKRSRFEIIATVTVFLLLIPLIAMQFTEVNWTLFDFVVAGGLLLVTGLTFELLMKHVKKTSLRIPLILIILSTLLLIWMELAVGVFGTALAGN